MPLPPPPKKKWQPWFWSKCRKIPVKSSRNDQSRVRIKIDRIRFPSKPVPSDPRSEYGFAWKNQIRFFKIVSESHLEKRKRTWLAQFDVREIQLSVRGVFRGCGGGKGGRHSALPHQSIWRKKVLGKVDKKGNEGAKCYLFTMYWAFSKPGWYWIFSPPPPYSFYTSAFILVCRRKGCISLNRSINLRHYHEMADKVF